MPPHSNNSLEISVKQLKNNTNGQQQHQNQQQQFSFQNITSLPLVGITNLDSGNTLINNTINNNFSNISNIISNQQSTNNSRQSTINTNNTITSPPVLQSSISFNFIVNEIDELLSNNNLNASFSEEEEEDDDEEYSSDLESNLSMEGMKNDSIINCFSNNNNNNSNGVFNNDFLSAIDQNTIGDSGMFPIKNEAFELTFNMISNFEQTQSQSIGSPFGNNQFITDQSNNNLQMHHSIDQNFISSNTNVNTFSNPLGGQIQIKKENLDDTRSSFSSTSDLIYCQQQQSGHPVKLTGKNEKRYGPITVRPRKNPAPTLRTGRKSKYIELTPEEARKRDLRRERNRQAAEKCKQKRSEIEDKLESDLKVLLSEQTNIQNEKNKLLEKKIFLENLLKQHLENCISNNNSNFPIKTNTLMYTTSQQVSNNHSNQPIYSTSIQQQQQQLTSIACSVSCASY